MSSAHDDGLSVPSARVRSLALQSAQEFQDLDELQTTESLNDQQRTRGLSDSDRDRSASDPPDPTRPNRYRGNKNTWKQWTVSERNIQRSLEQLRARDLSIHLYNAHALELRAQRLRAQRYEGNGRASDHPWEPPKHWTAWPLTAEEVPRNRSSDEDSFYDANQFSILERLETGSSRDFEDNLLAVLTRISRDQFREREDEGVIEGDTITTQPTRSVNSNTNLRNSRVTLKRPRSNSESSREQANLDVLEHSDEERANKLMQTEQDEDQMQEEVNEMQGDSGTASMDATVQDPPQTERAGRATANSSHYRAVPISDDNIARHLARPSLQHIFSRFEALLRGLHYSRYYQQKPKRRARHKKGARQAPRTKSEKKKPLGKHDLSKERKATIPTHEAPNSPDSETGSADTSPESGSPSAAKEAVEYEGKAKAQIQYNPSFGLQDWDDVLEVAAMQGWSEAVLERTRARCKALFMGSIEAMRP